MKCWLTVGFRQEIQCSKCGKLGRHREIRINSAGKIPTPCVWIRICDACWVSEDKFETPPFIFSDEEAPKAVPVHFG